MTTKKIVILAPHPDDEVIGCWSVLSSLVRNAPVEVWFVFGHDAIRRAEASVVGATLGFESVFVAGIVDLSNRLSLIEEAEHIDVYVPAITDNHPQHKLVNRAFRVSRVSLGSVYNSVRYYSVDLAGCAGKIDLGLEALRKRRVLDTCYPSQKSLWGSDASYYLFERIEDRDYTICTRTPVECDWCEQGTTVVTHDGELDRGLLFLNPSSLVDHLIMRGNSVFSFTAEGTTYTSR